MITPKDKALTPVEQAPAPLVSDERLTSIALGVTTREQVRRNRELQHLYNARYLGAAMMRDIYEAHLTQMRAERDELVGELRSQIQVYKDRMGEPTHEANCVCGYHRIEALLSKYKNE